MTEKKIPVKKKPATKKPAQSRRKITRRKGAFFPEDVVNVTQVTITVVNLRVSPCIKCPDDTGEVCRKTLCTRREIWQEAVGTAIASKGAIQQSMFAGRRVGYHGIRE